MPVVEVRHVQTGRRAAPARREPGRVTPRSDAPVAPLRGSDPGVIRRAIALECEMDLWAPIEAAYEKSATKGAVQAFLAGVAALVPQPEQP